MLIDYLEEIIDANFIYTSKGDEAHTNCPFCGDTRKRMYVNTVNHMVHCFNCNYGSTVVKLIADVQKIPYATAFTIFKDYNGVLHISDNVKDEVMEQLTASDYEKYLTKTAIPLPESFKPLTGSTSVLARRVRTHLHSRLVSDKMIERHKFGYCYDGEYEGRAILPIYENEQLQFWVARATSKNAYRKELSPSNEPYQIGKSEVIFNLDTAAKLYNAVVLTEGIYDAVAYGDIGTALLGKALSDEQLNKILKYKHLLTNGVYISIDEDAWKQAMEMAELLYQYVPVKICRVKDDPSAMGHKGCIEALSNAIEYTPLFKVRGLLSF